MYKKTDLTGKTFGYLTVIKYVGNGKYFCKCKCGNEHTVQRYNLKSGQVKSCGCSRQNMHYKKSSAIVYSEDDPILNLRIGIINQAIDDWRRGNKKEKEIIEKWLLSEWGQFLSDDMGEIIIEKLRNGE